MIGKYRRPKKRATATAMASVATDPELFKIQLPIIGGSTMLIYNRDRSIMGELPVTEEVKALFEKTRPPIPKIYIMGWVDSQGLLHIDETYVLRFEHWPSW